MKLVFATMPRSGSEFLVRLTGLLMDVDTSREVVSMTPGRFIDSDGAKLKDFILKREEGCPLDYFREAAPDYLKLESPGHDLLAYQLSCHYPESKWLGSLRSLEKIITSHFNLKTWGWSEDKILAAYLADLMFYEYIASSNRLFLININAPQDFNQQKMMDFFGIGEPGPRFGEFIREWRVVNPLVRQQKKAGEPVARKETPPTLVSLRDRHPWIKSVEQRYEALWQQSI